MTYRAVSVPVQLPLHVRKGLCGRLFYLRTLARHATQLQVSHRSRSVQSDLIQLTDNVKKWTLAEVGAADGPMQLDAFLDGLATRIEGLVPLLGKPPLKTLSLAVREALEEVRCQACSPLPASVCDGGAADDSIVAAGGHCVRPLIDLFNIAAKAARDYYSRYATCAPDLPIALAMQHWNGPTPGALPNYPVSGSARHEAPPSGPRSVVTLHLHVDAFDWGAFLACLYVLFHECIVHSFQGALSQAGPMPTTEEDFFAEGWMDAVSLLVLQDALQGPSAVGAPLEFGNDHLWAASICHASRCDWMEPKAGHAAPYRAYGREALQKLKSLLTRLGTPPQEAQAAVFRISFDINLLVPWERRETFVCAIYKGLPRPDELESPEHFDTARAVAKFLASRDLGSLLNDLHV